METFDADWLALREPADRQGAGRDAAGTVAVRRGGGTAGPGWSTWAAGPAPICGTLPRSLPPGQRWTLVDHDPRHVDRLRRLDSAAGGGLRSRPWRATSRLTGPRSWMDAHLVTGLGPAGSGVRTVACGSRSNRCVGRRLRRVLRADLRRRGCDGWRHHRRAGGSTRTPTTVFVLERRQPASVRIDKGFGPGPGARRRPPRGASLRGGGVPHLARRERLGGSMAAERRLVGPSSSRDGRRRRPSFGPNAADRVAAWADAPPGRPRPRVGSG